MGIQARITSDGFGPFKGSMVFRVMLPVILLLASLNLVAQDRVVTAGIPGVVAEGSMVELVQEGFGFTEGPVGTADGGLFFTDLSGSNHIYRMDPTGKIAVAPGSTTRGNGTALTRKGDFVMAEGQRISGIGPDGRVAPLTGGTAEGPLLATNDLIVDDKGGIYFTDPGPRPVVPGRKGYVYYLPAGSSQSLAMDNQCCVRPNGIALTTDGKTLFVDDAEAKVDAVFAFDVGPSGAVSNRRVFAQMHDIPPGEASATADGMAVDRDNRLYVSTVTGVQVFDKTGKYLGTIRVPRQPANVAFSGPNKRTLYITARQGLYRLQMLAQGPNRLGK